MDTQKIKDLIEQWSKRGFNGVRFEECRIGLCWKNTISLILQPQTYFSTEYDSFNYHKFQCDIIAKLKSLTDRDIDIRVYEDIYEYEICF